MWHWNAWMFDNIRCSKNILLPFAVHSTGSGQYFALEAAVYSFFNITHMSGYLILFSIVKTFLYSERCTQEPDVLSASLSTFYLYKWAFVSNKDMVHHMAEHRLNAENMHGKQIIKLHIYTNIYICMYTYAMCICMWMSIWMYT